MPTYAKETTVTAEGSRAEIERILSRYGADGFGYSRDDRLRLALIAFRLQNRHIRIRVPLVDRNDHEFQYVRSGYGERRRGKEAAERAWQQALNQRWRAVVLYVKATLEAVESGIVSVEDAFLPYTLLPSGQSVSEWIQPQVDEVYETKRMPALLPWVANERPALAPGGER